jgi:hypothetical protein
MEMETTKQYESYEYWQTKFAHVYMSRMQRIALWTDYFSFCNSLGLT